jgi:hypothetical protein
MALVFGVLSVLEALNSYFGSCCLTAFFVMTLSDDFHNVSLFFSFYLVRIHLHGSTTRYLWRSLVTLDRGYGFNPVLSFLQHDVSVSPSFSSPHEQIHASPYQIYIAVNGRLIWHGVSVLIWKDCAPTNRMQ